MKIAQVAPLWESVPPKKYGGTERVVHYLTEELVRQGHDVTLFASGDSQTSAKLHAVIDEAVGARQQGEIPFTDEVLITPPHMMLMDEVRKQADKFDIIHIHTLFIQYPYFRDLYHKTVTTNHYRLDIPNGTEFFNRFADMPQISISQSQRKPVPQANWKGTVYHGYPKDLYQYQPDTKRDYLAFIGRFSVEKGCEEAIKIARMAGIPLKIAAKLGNEDIEYFNNHVKPYIDSGEVDFIGEVDDKGKADLLSGAIATLFPICWPEPFGLVMIESMAFGTPVIGYRWGSVPEVIDEGKTGFVVENANQALEKLDAAKKLKAQDIRAVYEDRFSSERMASEYAKIYKSIIEKQK